MSNKKTAIKAFTTDFDRLINKVEQVNNFSEEFIEDAGRTMRLPLTDIVVKSNVRKHFNEASIKELADSMLSLGQQSPITVKRDPDNKGKWIIVTGERRYRAMQLLGEGTILAREDDGENTTAKQIVENIQREDMNILDIGQALHELKTLEGLNADQMGELIGKDPRFVYRALTVTELPKEIQELCIKNILRDGVATEKLLRLIKKNPDWTSWIIGEVIAEVNIQRNVARQSDEDNEGAAQAETEDETDHNIVITRKFIGELEKKLRHKVTKRRDNPIPLRDEPLTLQNADRLKRIKGYEKYKFNGIKARICCMFKAPDEFGDDDWHGDSNNPLECAQFTTISVDDPTVAIVEFQNNLYEVPVYQIMIKGVYSLKDLGKVKD